MLGREIFVEINVLHRQGTSIREISRRPGISRNTVRRRLRSDSVPVATNRSLKGTKLDNYRGNLQARMRLSENVQFTFSISEIFRTCPRK